MTEEEEAIHLQQLAENEFAANQETEGPEDNSSNENSNQLVFEDKPITPRLWQSNSNDTEAAIKILNYKTNRAPVSIEINRIYF